MKRIRPVWYIVLVFLAVNFSLGYFYNFPAFIFGRGDPKVNKKIILSWTEFFGIKLDDRYFDNCPELRQNCSIIIDRRKYWTADALVFHPRNMDWKDLPPYRKPSQYYLFLMHESPPHTCLDLDLKPNFFNWSFTYRMDSDVPYPYTYLTRDPSAAKALDTNAFHKNATKAPIAWLVSNCNTASKREIYADVLKKYIPIDIYGACGPLKCPKEVVHGNIHKLSKCEDMIDKDYYFYIAFENSVCKDYITEKYWARRDYNSIPIVLSRKVAEPLFPPNSFVAADDYPDGPKQLATYLKYLMENQTAYLEYFQWKTFGYVSTLRNPATGIQFGFCGICERLLRMEKAGRWEKKVYEKPSLWWGHQVSCDRDLVKRLLDKELKADPKLAASTSKQLATCGMCC